MIPQLETWARPVQGRAGFLPFPWIGRTTTSRRSSGISLLRSGRRRGSHQALGRQANAPPAPPGGRRPALRALRPSASARPPRPRGRPRQSAGGADHRQPRPALPGPAHRPEEEAAPRLLAVRLLLLTGARRDEILDLRWRGCEPGDGASTCPKARPVRNRSPWGRPRCLRRRGASREAPCGKTVAHCCLTFPELQAGGWHDAYHGLLHLLDPPSGALCPRTPPIGPGDCGRRRP